MKFEINPPVDAMGLTDPDEIFSIIKTFHTCLILMKLCVSAWKCLKFHFRRKHQFAVGELFLKYLKTM